MSVEAFSAIYPQIPIETQSDVDLLWTTELKQKDLLRKSYMERMDLESKDYLYADQIEADSAFYRDYPEWFGYLMLGKDFLETASKSKQFATFMPFQVDFMDTFIDPDVSQMGVVAARGGAKSWLLEYCSVLDCITVPQTEISVLAGSEKQSKESFDYAIQMCTHKKSGIGQHYDDLIDRHTTWEIDFKNGSSMERFVCSSTSTRGPRATKLVLDEVTQIKSDILEGFLGEATTSPDFKLAWGGTPDDPGHMAHTKWWCNRPDNVVVLPNGQKDKCHHWINYDEEDPDLSWHLFHWDAYDCLIEKGGWMYDKAIRAIKKLYNNIYMQRREIYAEWTSESGSILNAADVELASSRGYADFPRKLSEYNGVIISVDGARHSHYSTLMMTGWRAARAYVLAAKGWNHINDDDTKDMDGNVIPGMASHIMSMVSLCLDRGITPIVIIEDAPISNHLIDVVRQKCMELKVLFYTSTFKKKKNFFVQRVKGYFENGMISIPRELNHVTTECIMWRWSESRNADGFRVPEKGDDDYIDNLAHALYNDFRLSDKGAKEQHAGAKHDERKMSGILGIFRGGGTSGRYNPRSFDRRW